MIKVKNPNQLNIFDPWDFLTPKRRQMLDAGRPGLFREQILPSIPVDKVAKHFNTPKTLSGAFPESNHLNREKHSHRSASTCLIWYNSLRDAPEW